MWRFLQISDPHLGSHEDQEGNNRCVCSMMPEVIACLRRDVAELQPEFILVTGDVASSKSRDCVFAARDLIDSLGFPYYPVGGNCDFVFKGAREWFLEAFQAQLPVRDTVYAFTHRGLHFCVLDPWWMWSDDSLCPFREEAHEGNGALRWAIPPHQFEWLEHDLMAHEGLPSIVVVHFPTVPVPKRMQYPNMRDAGRLENGHLLVRVLRNHPQVKLILSGHSHMHYIVHDEGLTHVVTGAMTEYPAEYRDIHVYDDHLEIFTRGLSDNSFATRSLIEGQDWTAGQECDRHALIEL